MRQIVAMAGGGFSMEPDNPVLDDYILALAANPAPRVCFLPTASGDAESYILRFYEAFSDRGCALSHLSLFDRTVDDLAGFLCGQDILYVGGGNTANLLAIWRAHGMDLALRSAWEAGVILAGVSAGSLCWFESGCTDSFGRGLAPLQNGLGLIAGSHCPHYDGEAARRPVYQRCIAEGMAPGIAADNGVGLHYEDGVLAHVVSSRPEAMAYRVERIGEGVVETALPVTYLEYEESTEG